MSLAKRVEEAKRERQGLHQAVLRDVQALLDAPDAPAVFSPPPGDSESSPVVAGSTLRLLLAEIDPEAVMDDELTEALQLEAAKFLEDAVSAGCEICKRRRSDTLEPSDVALYLSLHRGLSVEKCTKPREKGMRRPDPAVIKRLRGARSA